MSQEALAALFIQKAAEPSPDANLILARHLKCRESCDLAHAVSEAISRHVATGTLAYALGAGKAIISTPYWHAAELLDGGRGALVPFGDPDAIAAAAIGLLDNDAARQAMRKSAYIYGRQMVWNRVAQSYMRTFVRASVSRMQAAHLRFPVRTSAREVEQRVVNA